MVTPTKIFISYARKDGRDLALRLQQDLTDFGFEVWLDTNEIQAGANWARDIENAIDNCHIALTLLSHGSFESEICRAEQQRAIEKKRRIVPILVMNCDRPLILQTLNFRDFSNLGTYTQNLTQLHTDLLNPESDKAPPVRHFFNDAPRLPEEFVPRPEEFDKLKNALLSDKTDRQVALTALRGLGGIGKSIMANAVCHDPFLTGAFPDGVFWIEIGREPSEILEKLRKIGTRLGDTDKNYISLTEAISSFRDIIKNKSALIVIDDVWEQTVDIAKHFISTSAQSRFLVTTRQQGVIEKLRATPVELGVMKPEQALSLISKYAKREDDQFPMVAQTLGYHPLALRIVGANLQKGTCDKWLKSYEITRVRLGMKAHERDDNLVACFDVSVESLAPTIEPALYHALGIFPEDMWIPAPTVYRLWGALNTDFTETDCDDILDELDNLSLIERQQAADGIRMHDLLHDYNRNKLTTANQYIPTQEHFIGALGDKYALPDDYAWRNIGYHLIEAGQKDTLRGLIFDYAFLDAKLHATDPNALIADCAYFEEDNGVSLVGDAMMLSSHVLTEHKDQLPYQLTGRLWQRRAQIADLYTSITEKSVFVWGKNLPNPPLAQAGGALKRILQHDGEVLCVAYSPDSNYLATGSDNGTARVWDVATGQTIHTLTGHTYGILSVAWDESGKHLAIGSYDRTVRVWDVATGQTMQTLTGHTDSVLSVAWDESGKHLATGSYDRTVRVWDVATGQTMQTLTGHTDSVRSVAWDGSGKRLATGSYDGTVRVWDVATGATSQMLTGHTDRVMSVAWDRSGKCLATGSDDSTARVWDIGAVGAIVLSSDDIPVQVLEGHTYNVWSVAWDKSGKRLATGSADGTARVWDIGAVGMTVLSSDDITVQVLEGHTNWVRSVAWDRSGKRLATGSDDGTARVWDVATGQTMQTLTGHTGWVRSVAWDKSGKRLATGSDDRTARVWDVATGQTMQTLTGHTSAVNSVAWDGEKHLATWSYGDTARVWDVATGQTMQTLTGHTSAVNSVAWDSDRQRLATGSDDNTAQIWDTHTGEIIFIMTGHRGYVNSVAWDNTGQRLATGSDDKTARIWDVQTGETIRTLTGHNSEVNSVAWDVSGKHLATGSWDRTAHVWDAQTGQCLAVLHVDASVLAAAWSPNGEWLALGCGDGRVLWVRVRV